MRACPPLIGLIPDAPALDPGTAITIDAWIYPTVLNGRIVDKITADGTDGYFLDVTAGVGRLRFTSSPGTTQTPTSVAVNTWTHVAATYDRANMRLYLNGVNVRVVQSTIAIPANAVSLRIGADAAGGTAFTGILDEVGLYNRALPDAETLSIAQSPAGRCRD